MKILVCTVGSPSLGVFIESFNQYAKAEDQLVVWGEGFDFPNEAKNFGDAYNAAMEEAFKAEEEVIIANDDVVLNPKTMPRLLEDVGILKEKGVKLGIVGVRSDAVLWAQNIRRHAPKERMNGCGWESEEAIIETPVVAPIFAWVPREVFQSAQLPPLNWYSDNVWCADLMRQGFRHFVSRAYVHHVGGVTTNVTEDQAEEGIRRAKLWCGLNRPEYLEWFP